MRGRIVVLIGIGLALSTRADWRDRLGEEQRLEQLRSGDTRARRDAASWLGRHGESEAASLALIEQLEREPDPDNRAAIAESLGRRGDPRAVIALCSSAGGMRDREREARLRALAAIESPLARRALAESLAGPGASIARAIVIDAGAPMIDALLPLLAVPAAAPPAAEALGAIGDARGAEALARHALDPEPETRAAVIDALGAIGDPRWAPIANAALEDSSPQVVAAGLRAISRIGSIEAVPAIEARLAHSEPAIAIEAWRALVRLDPGRAAAAIATVRDPALRAAISRAILEEPHPALLEPLIAIARVGGAGCDALARLPDPRGLIALVELAREGSDPARLAIALAVRRGVRASGALEAIAEEPDPLRRAWLGAIARRVDRIDPSALDPIGRAILARSIDPARLDPAIEGERDPITLEALARALVERGGTIDPRVPLGILDPSAEPARLILASIARRSGSIEIDRALARSVRGALRSRDPRTRAIAVESLARRGEARSTIAAAIEDPVPEVRLAAARALASEGDDPAIRERLRSRLAIEAEPRVRRALRDALDRRPASSGDRCLAVALERRGAPASIAVEIVLEDGRWIRERTLPSGELVVCGLPEADADLRLPP